MNPISAAISGKGYLSFLRRSVSIARQYGMTTDKMNRALEQFAAILRQFGCSATFPITSVALGRNPQVIKKYQDQGIEFAIHGYRHIDHCQLSQAEQIAQMELAKQLFAKVGIKTRGFRNPYLRWNPDTLVALQQQDLAYDSSQCLAWDVLDGRETPAYLRVLSFYGAVRAGDYPSLPSLENNIIRIPYSLPDDEALVERLDLQTSVEMNALWLAILHRTFELGELFTLGLHPERIAACQEPLTAVLSEARQLVPTVWIARLDEIAGWWRARTGAMVRTSDAGGGKFRLTATGPEGMTLLVRAVQVDTPTQPWANGYQQTGATALTLQAPIRPWIGLSPTASSSMADFLRQQGYIVEQTSEPDLYAYYFDQPGFTAKDKRPILAQIEGTDRPLVRLGRWPNGARSALSITGDIDALTLWDYGLRLLGK